jgi:hypothetical protein
VTGVDGGEIVAVLEELCGELGDGGELSEQGRRWADAAETGPGPLNREGEELVVRLRGALARLASAAQRGDGGDGRQENAVIAALDGAELVTRGEILLGNGAGLSGLAPSFAFLATLPVTGKERALELSRRVEELLEDAGG